MAIEGKLPFDDAPPWLVDIVRHDAPSHDAKVASDELDLAGRALQLRRDRAEAILDWLLAEGRACDPDALHAMVTSYGERVAKPRHLKRIQRIRAGRAEFDRIAREFQAHYSNGKWGNGTELQRLGEQLLSLAASPEEKIRALHAVGVERMSAFRAGAPRDALDRSRVALTEASAMLRTGDYMPDLAVAVLVSTGNTWRLGDDADPDKALEHYSEAESLNPSEAHFQGQLHKVIADALILRSKPEDLAQARKHIDRSLEARRDGPLRMETLLTAVDLELADRVSPRAKCLERAIRYFEEALTLCPDSVARALVRDRVIPIAAEHRRLAHDSTAAKRILDTASARFPDLAVEIAAAQRGAAEAIDRVSIDEVLHILRHPACALVAEATFDLDPETILEPRMRERVSGVLTHRPESPPTAELRDRVRHLEGESVPEKQPGALVATALLLSKLAAAGEDVIARARRTADLAEAAISSIPDPAVRAFLHLHLSSFWAPSDHNSNPTRDFKRGAEYLESALIEIPSDARIRGDFLLRHARATRYRTDGGALQHMRRAEGLYHEALALAKAMGDEISANQILFNLQELAVALGRGGETENLQQSVETTREIAEWSGGSSFLHLIALARDYTLLGCRQGGHEAIQSLQEGQRVFERLFREHRLPSGTWEDARNYEVMGRVELALRSGNADRAVALWRDRLAEQGNEVGHARRGITLHNLADTLTRVGRTYHEALEAIRLCDEAIRLRFEVGDPQHLWETHHLRGDATRCALEHAHGEVSQAARQDLWTKGVKTYESAIRLARELGKGERLLRSAIGLGMLALRARTISAMLPLAETCWTAIDEARQTLPYAERLAFQETSLATAMGARILQMAGQQDVDGELGGRRGVIVAQWILRAAGGQQRRLGARWRRPEETPDQLWRDWLRALKTDDVREIGRVAESIQAHAPFLSAEVDFAGVERWLAKEPASAGIVVLPCSAGHISAVFTLEEGQLAVTCKLLEGPVDSPREPQELFLSDHPFTSSKYTQMLARAKQRVVVPLRQLLPSTTKNLLWHGSGDLRLISPHDLWPGLAVTSALDFALKGAAEPHHAATAIVIADPDTADARIPQSVETGEHLARVLSDSTPRRLRFSRGATYGSHLEITARGLIDAPADPDGVLEDLKECSRVVMMCHGGFSDSSDPVLFLLDERGNRSELNLDRIAADPGAFVGATVILLACWAGQVGPRNYQVEGFPAVFLACGARRVIAPLWPVYVHAAVEVGTSLLRALETGRRPDEALAALIRQYQRSGQRDLLDSARAFVIYEA
ncbi:MAG TPA: CHAT domain-containing protein [Nannocystaceae bacterium]|nr:CHAT domain-containing protein [Nannocystaceae bacterium]